MAARVLTLSAETLASLAAQPAVVAEFPFLATPPPGRGCCGKAAGKGFGTATVRRLARTVLNLSPARLAAFKALAGVDKVAGPVVSAGRLVRKEV